MAAGLDVRQHSWSWGSALPHVAVRSPAPALLQWHRHRAPRLSCIPSPSVPFWRGAWCFEQGRLRGAASSPPAIAAWSRGLRGSLPRCDSGRETGSVWLGTFAPCHQVAYRNGALCGICAGKHQPRGLRGEPALCTFPCSRSKAWTISLALLPAATRSGLRAGGVLISRAYLQSCSGGGSADLSERWLLRSGAVLREGSGLGPAGVSP